MATSLQLNKKFLVESAGFIILALLMYVPIFGYLDTLPIRMWDESRTTINAYEMYKNGNWIVTYYNGEPEMWNTKPPLLIWIQVIFMHLIGVNEIAIRLPSALAAFGTCLALLVFSMRYLKSFWLGFIAVVLLISSEGYIQNHVVRTGDFDSMLTFFTTLCCLFLYSYSETKRIKFLHFFFISLTLAALTKGIAALMFTPAWFLFIAWRRQLPLFLKNRHFYFGLAYFLFPVIGYYFLRDSQNPGYIDIVIENELGGRYLVSQGDQVQNFWYYLDNFMVYRLADRYLLIPCGMAIGLISAMPRIRLLSVFLMLTVLTFFIVISAGKTRLEWYDAPLYPFLSVFVGFIIHFLFRLVKENEWMNRNLTFNVIPYIFLFLILFSPYRAIFSKLYAQTEYSWDNEFYQIGHYLKKAINGKYNLNGKFLIHDGYSPQNDFYLRILRDKGVDINFKFVPAINVGDIVIANDNKIKGQIAEYFETTQIENEGVVTTYSIVAKKEIPAQ